MLEGTDKIRKALLWFFQRDGGQDEKRTRFFGTGFFCYAEIGLCFIVAGLKD